MKLNRRFLSIVSLLTVSATTTFTAFAEKPNVVFFLIDDLSYFGLPAYGAESVSSTQGLFKNVKIKTPAMNKLAEGGLRCDYAYARPICEPTRIALMTGMHNGRNFVTKKALHESQITFSDVLKNNGYVTGMYGKWKQSRGTKRIPAKHYISQFGWDDYTCFDVEFEGSRFINPNLVINGKPVNYGKGNTKDVDPATGRRWYGPDIVNRAALKFIDTNKDKPFFLYYPLMLVHDEHTPTPDTRPKSLYDNFDTKKKYSTAPLKGDDRTYFPDMLHYMDKMIGNVIKRLDKYKLTKNTLVIVMGDNGAKGCFEFTMKDGRVLQGGKGHTRAKGEQVPLTFTWPGRVPSEKGKIRAYEGVVDIVDIYPTLIEACGIKVPNQDKIDGISLWPQIVGTSNTKHRTIRYEWFNGNNPFWKRYKKSVSFTQSKDYKLYAPHGKFPRGRFFDVKNDPNEEAGKKVTKVGWQNWHYSGLDIDNLTSEQKKAYNELKKVLKENEYKPIEAIQASKGEAPIRIGGTRQLEYSLTPADVTRNNIVWKSSNPKIATVDKFGVLTAHQKGKVTINVYSWDDALPMARGRKYDDYKTEGVVTDTMTINIQ